MSVLVVICCLTTLFMLTDIVQQYRARNASLEMLSRLEGRNHWSVRTWRDYMATGIAVFGRPNCNGCQRSTFAANYGHHHQCRRHCCLYRNAAAGSAIERWLRDGNCQLRAWSRKRCKNVLYDIEAGLPFLFVDQLVVQTPSAAGRGRTVAGDAGRGGTVAGGKIMPSRAILNFRRAILVGLMSLFGLISAASQQSSNFELRLGTQTDQRGAPKSALAHIATASVPSRADCPTRARSKL